MNQAEVERFDLVVIGGGTAGLVTAAGAAAMGARVALVERARLGGDCLWTGCVPSKVLIGSARVAKALRDGAAMGLGDGVPLIDGARVMESVRQVRARIQAHDSPERFRALGVEVVEMAGRFLSPKLLEAGTRRLTARRFVIATGTHAAVPPIPGLEEVGYFTHEHAFERNTLPASVLVLGGGAIGVEFAQAYRRLGSEVTLLEMEDGILLKEESEITERLTDILLEEGVRIVVCRRATEASMRNGKRSLTVEDESGATEAFAADEILVAAGRRPNIESLGLDRAGVETGPAGILVDAYLRTSQKHIFAIGDVTGGYLFTHVADHEARTVLLNALAPVPLSRIDYSVIPWTTFTDPELARVGLTEKEARELYGDSVRVYRYDLSELDRAIADHASAGCVRLIADRKGRLLGGHILAPGAGTMIVEVALAIKHGIRVQDISKLVHPYPTMSEGIRRAADGVYRARLSDRKRRLLGRYFRWMRKFGH